MAVAITADALLEGCYPLGDRWHDRDVKRTAVRRVMLEGWSYLRAGREAGANHESVAHWVGDTEERIRHVKAAMTAAPVSAEQVEEPA